MRPGMTTSPGTLPRSPSDGRPSRSTRARGTAAQWAATAIASLVVLVAVQQPLWALLLRLGVPEAAVRALRFTKEGLVAVVVLAAVAALLARPPRQQDRVQFVGVRGSRWDGVDLAVGAWVALVTGYLVAGLLAGEQLFPRTTDDPWLQLVAYRSLVVGPVLLVAVRSVPLLREHRQRILTAILVAGGLLSVVAMFEVVAPGVMEDLASGALRYRGYQARIFGIDLPYGVVVQTTFGDEILVTRAGSLLFDYLQLGFFLVPAFAIALVRVADAARPDRWQQAALLGLLAAGILATVTRTAIVAAGVAVVVVVLTLPDEALRRRARSIGLTVLAVAVVVAVPTGIAARMVAGLAASDASSNEHVAALELGATTVATNPLGIGVGSTAEVGVRTDATSLIVENAYLDIGVQTGVLGMLAFVAMVVVVMRALRDRLALDRLAAPALAAVVAFSVGSLLLHAWLMIEASWVVHVLAGMALRRDP